MDENNMNGVMPGNSDDQKTVSAEEVTVGFNQAAPEVPQAPQAPAFDLNAAANAEHSVQIPDQAEAMDAAQNAAPIFDAGMSAAANVFVQPQTDARQGYDPAMAFDPQAGVVNMYGDAPQTPEAPKKKKKTGLIIGIIAAVLAVAAIVCVLVLVVFKKEPKEAIKDAMKKTVEEDGKEATLLGNVLGIDDFDPENMDLESTLKINSVMGDTSLSGADVIFGASADGKNASVNAGLTYNNATLSTMVYVVDNIIYYELPEICDSVFKLDVADVAAQSGINLDDSAKTAEEIQKLYDEYLGDANKNFSKAVTYEKIGKETFTNHNGDSVKATKYTVTVPSAAIKDYIAAVCNAIADNADKYVTDEMLQESGMTLDEFKTALKTVPTYTGYVFGKDFTCDFYIKKGKVVRIQTGYAIALLGAKLDIVADYMGDKNVLTDTYCGIAASYAETAVTVDTTYKLEDSKATSESVVKLNDKELSKATNVQTYDKSSGNFSSVMTVTADGVDETLTCDFEAQFADISKGKSFNMNNASFSLKDSNGTEYINISGTAKAGDLSKTVSAPDSSKNVVDMKDMDDSAMESLIDEGKLEEIMKAWSELIETLSSASGSSVVDGGEINFDDFEFEDADVEDGEDGDSEDLGDGEEIEFDEDAFEDVDYSGITMKSADGKTIAITEPGGYERDYADDETISMYDSSKDVSVSYSVYAIDDLQTYIDEEISTYKDFYGDSFVENVAEFKDVTVEGTTVKCYELNATFYDAPYVNLYYFYPLSDNNYVVVNTTSWDENYDINAFGAELLASSVMAITE